MSRTLPAVPARNRPYPTGGQPPAEPLPEPRCTRRPGPEPGGAAGQSRSAPYPMYDCSTSQCVGRFPSVASSSKIFICRLRCFPLAGTLGSCCQFARKHGGPRPGEHAPHPDGRRGQRHPHRARRSAAAEPHARVPPGHRPSSRKAEAGAPRRDRSRAGPGCTAGCVQHRAHAARAPAGAELRPLREAWSARRLGASRRVRCSHSTRLGPWRPPKPPSWASLRGPAEAPCPGRSSVATVAGSRGDGRRRGDPWPAPAALLLPLPLGRVAGTRSRGSCRAASPSQRGEGEERGSVLTGGDRGSREAPAGPLRPSAHAFPFDGPGLLPESSVYSLHKQK